MSLKQGQAAGDSAQRRIDLPALQRKGLCLCVSRGQGIEMLRLGGERPMWQRGAELTVDAALQGSRGEVWAVLTRQDYLTLTLDVPQVDSDELRQMLMLEAQAQAPQEFGPMEMAYASLGDCGQGLTRYELYIARVEAVSRLVQTLVERGVRPTRILPSAALWREAISLSADACRPLLAVSPETETAELIFPNPDGSLWIRTLDPQSWRGAESLVRLLSESIVSLSPSAGEDDFELSWLGFGSELHAGKAGLKVHRLDAACWDSVDLSGEFASQPIDPTLAAGALFVDRHGHESDLIDGLDLTPYSDRLQRRGRVVLRRAFTATLMLWCAVMILLAGIKLTCSRYSRRIEALNGEIASIRVVGEQVERLLLQLDRIRTAKASTSRLYDVIAGLYDATPEGITYSQIDLASSLEMRISGQAPSSSLPFLLPQALEEQPAFGEVIIRDVGQKARGDGVKTEFRLECALRKGGRP